MALSCCKNFSRAMTALGDVARHCSMQPPSTSANASCSKSSSSSSLARWPRCSGVIPWDRFKFVQDSLTEFGQSHVVYLPHQIPNAVDELQQRIDPINVNHPG